MLVSHGTVVVIYKIIIMYIVHYYVSMIMNACNIMWRELEPSIRHFSAFISYVAMYGKTNEVVATTDEVVATNTL